MEPKLLEEPFEDIFSDPSLLVCAENPDDDSTLQVELEEGGSATGREDIACNASSRKSKSLNKKEKAKILEALRHNSGMQLLDVVVKKLSQESHMQFYPEREQLQSSLLDSSGDEMAAICAELADNFVCVCI